MGIKSVLIREMLTATLVKVMQDPQALVRLKSLESDGSHELRRSLGLQLVIKDFGLADDVKMSSPGLAIANDLDVAIFLVVEHPKQSLARHSKS